MTPINKVKSSKAKCKRHRDNWKAKALAYQDIIADLQAIRVRGGDEIMRYRDMDQILAEAKCKRQPRNYWKTIAQKWSQLAFKYCKQKNAYRNIIKRAINAYEGPYTSTMEILAEANKLD